MKFKGSYVAIVTPMSDNGGVDFKKFVELLHFQKAGGSAGVVVCGTTGESPTVSIADQLKLFEVAVAELKSTDLHVIAGTGSNNTKKTVEMTQKAKDLGVDGALIVTPYYNKPNFAGISAHYSEINKVGLPLILYNIPGRTGVNIDPESIQKLCQSHSQIKAVKASNGDLDQILETCARLAGTDVSVLSGDDGITLPIMSVGGVGLVSVFANVAPKVMSTLVDGYLEGKHKESMGLAQAIHKMCTLTLTLGPNPVPIKALMNHVGLKVGEPLLPLVALSKEDTQTIHSEYLNLQKKYSELF